MDKKTRFIAAKKKFQEEHRRLGLCYDCNNLPDNGKTRCSYCLAKRKINDQARRATATSLGLCAKCCKQPRLDGNRFCEDCYFKRTSRDRLGTIKHWQRLKEKFHEQKGLCALSSTPMTLGKNAELDHITPSARGGSDNPDNTQWVLCIVNRMKDHMIESEFFTLVESVYFTMKGDGDKTD